VDLVELVEGYTRLRPCGRQFVGLCPLHSERHASFYVHPGKQVFKCFGCGAGGDVFEFLMRATGCDFRCALEIVAELTGVASESEPRSGERFRAGVGASPQDAKRPASYSQSSLESRARILAALDATNRRLSRIEATNRAALASLATACEPEPEAPSSLYLSKNG